MAILKKLPLLLTLLLCTTSCGLFDDIAAFDPAKALPDCDAPCGACDLGRWSCAEQTCLSGLTEVNDNAVCGKDVIFVAEAGTTNAQGTREAPYKTLSEALSVAGERKAKAIVIAGSPTIEGPITLIDGVNIYGGYDSGTWTPSSARPKIITTNAPTNEPLIGVRAIQLDRPVSISRIEIQAQAHPGGPTIGILSDNTKTLTLRDVVVLAGAAGDGIAGEPGANGANGNIGGAAGTGRPSVPGSPGLNNTCTEANGARGGPGAINNGQQTTNAEPGATSSGGANGGEPKLRGQTLDPPSQAQSGQDASNWTFENAQWTTTTKATEGQTGQHGPGGGGGGGGTTQPNGEGGGGGGGGAGGCGGFGGKPGTNGWPSTGVILLSSKLVLVNGTVITGGAGGNAGPGGEGGMGGMGARGGQGAMPQGAATAGGSGGNGANGGVGGRGGHGAAGPSFGLYCNAQSTLEQPDNTQPTIEAGQGGITPDNQRAASQAIVQCQVKP